MRVIPASRFAIRDLTEFWNLSYSGYFVPVSFTEEMLTRWIFQGTLDLDRSPVLMEGDAFAGISLLGIRGSRGWIGGSASPQSTVGRGWPGASSPSSSNGPWRSSSSRSS